MAGDYPPSYTGTYYYSTSPSAIYRDGSYIYTSYTTPKEPKEWKLKPHKKFLQPTFNIPLVHYMSKPIPSIKNIPNHPRNAL